MNQKGFAPILIVVGILGLAITLAGGYLLGRSDSKPTKSPPTVIQSQPTFIPKSTPQPTIIPQPSPNPDETTKWQFIDADKFTLSLPPTWKFNKLQGIDSYVGEFVGDGANLSFDFGWYSSSLAKENDPKHVVTYETIGGYRAKIVVPKVTGDGTTGVYFGDLGGEVVKTVFNIYGQNLTSSQQETALKIFRTIGFKK